MESSRTGKCFISVHVSVFAVAMCMCVVGVDVVMLCQPDFSVFSSIGDVRECGLAVVYTKGYKVS